MSNVFMTLSGEIYIKLNIDLMLNISDDNFILYDNRYVTDANRRYFMVNNVLSYIDDDIDFPAESIFSEASLTITNIKEGTYSGEVTIVPDDFLENILHA